MKNTKNMQKWLVLGCASLLLAACSNDVPEIPVSELYTREWVKNFGVVDPRQDWNNATRGSVEVMLSRASDVKITTRIGDKNYLLADYADVQGSRSLAFDMPRGVEYVTVKALGQALKTKVGSRVSFDTAGRAIWDSSDGNIDKDPNVTITRGDYKVLTTEETELFLERLPEEQDNLKKVTQNFYFVSNGDFTIYPIYWQTAGTNTMFIYYVDEETNEMVHIPFYTHKIGSVDGSKGNLLYTTEEKYNQPPFLEERTFVLKDPDVVMPAMLGIHWEHPEDLSVPGLDPTEFCRSGCDSFLKYTEADWADFKSTWFSKQEDFVEHYFETKEYAKFFEGMADYITSYRAQFGYTTESQKYPLNVVDFKCKAVNDTHVGITEVTFGDVDGWKYVGDSNQSGQREATAYKSRGINISIKKGTRFGIGLLAWYNNEADRPTLFNTNIERMSLNADGILDNTNGIQSDGRRRFYSEAKYNPEIGNSNVFGATYFDDLSSGEPIRVLAFEDYGSPHDLNDMVFYMTSANIEEIPDVEDIDNPEEPIKWLIACEDLGASDDFDFNDVVFEVEYVAGKGKAKITPLAAGGTLDTYLCCSHILGDNKRVSQTEWHALFDGNYVSTEMINTGNGATRTAQPITIAVDDNFSISSEGGSATDIYKKNMGGFYLEVKREDRTVTEITAPGEGDAPQMILIFQGDNKWCWPRERCHIHKAYPSFQTWSSPENGFSFDKAEECWFHTPVNSFVFQR